MADEKFRLKARVSSSNLFAIKPVLERIIANKGTIKQTEQGFEVEADLQGESARALNRMILSELRKVEKRTQIRAEWTSGNATEKFFDYVPKGTPRAQGK